MSEIVRSNIMQRLFDALPPPESPMLSITHLTNVLPFGEETIKTALKRLGRLRCVKSTYLDGEWRYGLRLGAKRPADSRGRRRR